MRGCHRPARALVSDRRGATTVEFGIIAVPFLVLVLAILELALVFLASGSLDTATAGAARTESLAGVVPTRAAVAERICGEMPGFGRDCGSALQVELEELAASSGGSSIVVVRAVYRWPLLSPLIGRVLAGGDGAIALVATNAFRLESS
jgi:Flp pilus assembly pilin Flp